MDRRSKASTAARAALAVALAGALACAGAPARASLVRVTCKGTWELARTAPQARCAERDVRGDGDGRFLGGLSRAAADRHAGTMSVGAAGAATRTLGYQGRESSSIVVETVSLSPAWRGVLPVTVELRVRYEFVGDGESRLAAMLRGAAAGVPSEESRARLSLSHRERGGARLQRREVRGRSALPVAGAYPRDGSVALTVTALVSDARPQLRLRADLAAAALPNLGPFEDAAASMVAGDAEIVVSAPCPVVLASASGRVHAARAAPAPSGAAGFSCHGPAPRDAVVAAATVLAPAR